MNESNEHLFSKSLLDAFSGYVQIASMRTSLLLLALFYSVGATFAADVYPQLSTLDGKTYLQVKVTKASATEIRIMHTEGFATIPLSALPPEIRSKYGVADAAAEAAEAQQRKMGNVQAAMAQRQEKEALQIMEISGQPLQLIKQAISNRDWCLANPAGGLFNGATVTAEARNQLLAQAMEVLNTRPAPAVAEVPPPAAPMPGTPAAPPAAGAPAAPAVAVPGFVPGVIQIISARYSLPNEQARNVKNRFTKLVPTGTVNAPVSILVTDQLSDAALDQGNYTTATGAGVAVTNGNVTAGVVGVVVQEQNRNMLTVEYMYNGQKFKKQAIEGSYIVLP